MIFLCKEEKTKSPAPFNRAAVNLNTQDDSRFRAQQKLSTKTTRTPG